MGAWLERDIESCAPCPFASGGKRNALRMRTASGVGGSLRDDDGSIAALVHDDRADRRIGPGESQITLAQGYRQTHEALVLRGSIGSTHHSDCCAGLLLRGG